MEKIMWLNHWEVTNRTCWWVAGKRETSLLETGQRWSSLMPTEKGGSCASPHTEVKMPNTPQAGLVQAHRYNEDWGEFLGKNRWVPRKEGQGSTASSATAWPVTGHFSKKTHGLAWFSSTDTHTSGAYFRVKTEITVFPGYLDTERCESQERYFWRLSSPLDLITTSISY